MKKTAFQYCLCVIMAVLVLFSAVGCSSEKKETSYETEQQLFGFATTEETKAFCEKKNLVCRFEDEYQVIYDASCFGQQSQLFYSFDEQGQIYAATAYALLFGYPSAEAELVEEFSAEDLQKKCGQVLEALCKMHGAELQNNFLVLDYEQWTQLDVTQKETFQKIKDMEAYLEFTLLDTNGCYWKATSECMPDGAVFLVIEKQYDSSDYAELVPNIIVE